MQQDDDENYQECVFHNFYSLLFILEYENRKFTKWIVVSNMMDAPGVYHWCKVAGHVTCLYQVPIVIQRERGNKNTRKIWKGGFKVYSLVGRGIVIYKTCVRVIIRVSWINCTGGRIWVSW